MRVSSGKDDQDCCILIRGVSLGARELEIQAAGEGLVENMWLLKGSD